MHVPSLETKNETWLGDLGTRVDWTRERPTEASDITVRTVRRLEADDDDDGASSDTLPRLAKTLEVPLRDLSTALY
jgi:hypothetical protein